MKQKDVFLQSEGDSWLARNKEAVRSRELPMSDPVLMAILAVDPAPRSKILEIGCSDGARLAWLQRHRQVSCQGIEPSAQAVAAARAEGVDAIQGTADRLPFENGTFDMVVFGFCLYLCDRQDLFRIAAEADRVLRDPG